MSLPQVKKLILEISLELQNISKDICFRDLITIPDHTNLIKINNQLLDAYNLLDLAYQETDYKNTQFDEPMEFVELVRKRVAAIAEYIRPYRLKNEHTSPPNVIHLINTELQAMHHLSSVLSSLSGESHD